MYHPPLAGFRPRRPLAGGEAGAAAVEFALVMPVLLAIVFGIIVYGLYFTVQIAVTEAAAVGARAAVAGLDCGERKQFATTAFRDFFGGYGGLLSPTTAELTLPTDCPSGTFWVKVSYPIDSFSLNLMGGLVPVPTSNPTATVTVSTGGL
jgi:Flp pilus assembly protein TadG